MDENTNNLDKEIEEGLARAEKMLCRRRFFISTGTLFCSASGENGKMDIKNKTLS
jgi:hypothetical protein